MPNLNIFQDDAFSLTSLTAAIQNVPYQPARISSAGLYAEEGIVGLDFYIEIADGVLELIPVSQRGAPAQPAKKGNRIAKSFRVAHVKQNDALLADQIMGVRAFGTESEVETMARIVGQRLATMASNIRYTLESHRLLGLKGVLVDALGNQVNLYSEFNVAQKVVPFVLTSDDTKVRGKCLQVLEHIEEALGGLSFTGVEVLCGKNFWADLIDHKAVADTYLNTQQAAELRGDGRNSFEFGGLNFERYRGTSAVKVDDNEAIAYPVGVQSMFLTRYAAADWIETVNTLGQPMYAKQWEMEAGRGINLEAQASPINLNTRPGAVIRLKKGAS